MAAKASDHAQLAERAIVRCLDELARAILYKRALQGAHESGTYHGIDFVRLCTLALYDQMFSHAIKVLDPRERAGLFYLTKEFSAEASRICAEQAIDLAHILDLTKGLRLIRDKTHFHLDARGVLEPAKVWQEADINGHQFSDALDAGFRLLCGLHKYVKGAEYELPEYDERDATRILLLADHAGLSVTR